MNNRIRADRRTAIRWLIFDCTFGLTATVVYTVSRRATFGLLAVFLFALALYERYYIAHREDVEAALEDEMFWEIIEHGD